MILFFLYHYFYKSIIKNKNIALGILARTFLSKTYPKLKIREKEIASSF